MCNKKRKIVSKKQKIPWKIGQLKNKKGLNKRKKRTIDFWYRESMALFYSTKLDDSSKKQIYITN